MAIEDIELVGYGLDDPLPLIDVSIFQIVMFAIVLIVGIVLVRVATSSIRKAMMKKNMGEILSDFLTRVLRLILYVFVIGVALGFLGVSVGAALVSVSVVLGFVLGFALGDTLSNIAAGFMIAITKPFSAGDYVTVNGESGSVKSVGISITELTTPDNKHIIIPNSKVWGSNIINFTSNPTRRIDLQVGVGYGDDLNKAIQVTNGLLSAHPKILKDPASQVAVVEMGDSAVNIVIRPWVKTEDYWDVFFELQKSIKETYDANGISIPYPQTDVHIVEQK